MQEKEKARLRELAPAARGSQEAGFTQPSLYLFLHVCTDMQEKVKARLRELAPAARGSQEEGFTQPLANVILLPQCFTFVSIYAIRDDHKESASQRQSKQKILYVMNFMGPS